MTSDSPFPFVLPGDRTPGVDAAHHDQKPLPLRRRAKAFNFWRSFPFGLLILTNGLLFIRPGDLFPTFDVKHLYEILILSTLIFWLPQINRKSSIHRILSSPLGVCVLGLLPLVLLSNLVHGRTYEARTETMDFARLVIYFILLVGIINTPQRLRTFLKWITIFICILTAMALLEYHHVIHIEALATFDEAQDQIDPTTGQALILSRLCAAGIFNDPNDLCLILMMGCMLSLYWFHDARARGYQVLWLLPVGMFGYGVWATHSRGGFLSMMGAFGVLMLCRIGWKKSILVFVIALPALLVVFGGRQTDITTEDQSANQRIQLWSAGLEMFKSSPIFGIGMKRFEEEAGLVAHNSYVHCYAELGFFGGTLFLGAFFYSMYSLIRLGKYQKQASEPVLRVYRPYLLATMTAYCIGYLTLSRAYVETTYLMLALVAIYLDFAAGYRPQAVRRLSYKMVGWAMGIGVAFIGVEYVFVNLFARWS